MLKKKYYVVWKGLEPGIYDSWEGCKKQIYEFEGALYKSFETQEAAEEAYTKGSWAYFKKKEQPAPGASTIIADSLAVDAACSGNPGKMEYRGVYVKTGEEIFRKGPYEQGTNNIGEFLAIVHGLALLKNQKNNLPIYSDSVNAMLWIKNKKCKTKLEPNAINKQIFDMIAKAETWLENNPYETTVLKWETGKWGEIPADFGRKH